MIEKRRYTPPEAERQYDAKWFLLQALSELRTAVLSEVDTHLYRKFQKEKRRPKFAPDDAFRLEVERLFANCCEIADEISLGYLVNKSEVVKIVQMLESVFSWSLNPEHPKQKYPRITINYAIYSQACIRIEKLIQVSHNWSYLCSDQEVNHQIREKIEQQKKTYQFLSEKENTKEVAARNYLLSKLRRLKKKLKNGFAQKGSSTHTEVYTKYLEYFFDYVLLIRLINKDVYFKKSFCDEIIDAIEDSIVFSAYYQTKNDEKISILFDQKSRERAKKLVNTILITSAENHQSYNAQGLPKLERFRGTHFFKN